MAERAPHLAWFERLGLRAVHAEELALARIVFFGWTALCNWRRDSALWVPFAELDFRPPGLAKLLGLRFASGGWMEALDVAWVAVLLASAVGLFSRWAMALSLLLGVYLLALPHGIGRTQHSDAVLVFVMAAFALSRAGDAWSLDALLEAWRARRQGTQRVAPAPARSAASVVPSVEYAWPQAFTLLCLVIVYFAAGIAKLRETGIDWGWNEGGRLRLIAHAYTHSPPTQLGLLLAEAGAAPRILGTLAFALELSCPLALVLRPARWLIVGGLFLLQLGIWLTLGVFFDGFFGLFALCIPWLRLRGSLGRWALRRAPPASVRSV